MSDEGHVSIGDVLNQLRDEFSDVTISKIRFLESQGLVDPERTPSGYRKFYPGDVERLRWILRQQKDHFLPLKVIKDRLDEIDASGGFTADGPVAEPAAAGVGDATPQDAQSATKAAADEEPRAAKEQPTAAKKAPRAAKAQPTAALDLDLDLYLDDDAAEKEEQSSSSGVSLTRAELAHAAGLDDAELAALEEYGIVTPALAGRDRALFDEHALAAARVAAGFRQYGIEPRHLRMYRAFADREATLFEQVLLQYARRRNPDAQARADAAWNDLARLGRRMRRVLLEQAMGRSGGGGA